jgi:RNA ligase
MSGNKKVLDHKSYGSIPHLIGSRVGPADHHCEQGQHDICTVATRDKHDTVVVLEKLDGSNVAVANIGKQMVPITRSGYHARSSPYAQHHLFADWVDANPWHFEYLAEGERYCGEWLALAHGTVYRLDNRIPFVLFDVMRVHERKVWEDVQYRAGQEGLPVPTVLSDGASCSIDAAMKRLGKDGHYGAQGMAEGAVWRVERNDKVDFLAKYVRPSKKDGVLLKEISGGEDVWNWQPKS